ncbi:aromatic prenyltransferase [Thelephora ganbajun]|uniref:Aromatic prenyltransferase n=1 Tax=Thelephora ganbajun TaxID=370292 RepID=A0ACB6ZXD2_THEGA|nr:aromatic prenyltransferase [Thelephora ganbajun]
MAPDSSKRNKHWWRVIGRVLSTLLSRSSYSEETRIRYDNFFKAFVAPLLGPSPEEYTSSSPISFMCDDHTPVEIGWVFKSTGEMSVQYAIEALSPIDGSPISTHQNLIILQNLAAAGQCQGFNVSWSRKCTQSLLYPSRSLPHDLQRDSQFFIGIDLARTGMGLKAYFLPQVRSRMTGVPVMDILTPTINDLGMGLQWSKATSYFSTLPAEFNVQPVIAAVDCVSDDENRFKVYVRTQATHLSALCDMLTLGGQLKGPAIDATLAKLRELWRALFGSISDDAPVKHKRSNKGPTGFLFYYEMAINNSSPIPKIYIPASRFLENDAHVARVISQFVGSGYCDDVRSLFPHRDLESRSGIHSHITLAAKKGACQISSYLNPEAFSQHF